ncbi:hypothetical protein [Candidatus Nanohalovita haloferacivicina]|uniref:hypothetical protein n=1 Tax=Candidatus Nanohalovita haloferacivicina TaxID=2978046 RepID=UPI00325FC8BF|nr:hypothetical protein HBNXNv_0565 [Candidatus Nanohalobia archaeon BNXNv]
MIQESESLEAYSGSFYDVDVDQCGFYDGAVAMEELCYCVGAVSIHEDGLYATHISPGEIGGSPEQKMAEFQEGEETYVFSGAKSDQYDPETLKTVISGIEGEFELLTAKNFVINEEGEIFDRKEEETRRGPLI